jgi:hypothetical protein
MTAQGLLNIETSSPRNAAPLIKEEDYFYNGSGLTAGVVAFGFVETAGEYDEVVSLRLSAYSTIDRVAPVQGRESMADEFDGRSKIVIGRYRGQIVCSVRMVFHGPGDRLEQERFVTWPQSAPCREDIVEVTRACVRDDFRGSDLFLSMLRFCGQQAVRHKMTWVVTCASPELVRFYLKMGARRMGLSYDRTFDGNVHHMCVLIAHVRDALTGQGVNPVYWNLAWRGGYEALAGSADFEPTLRERIRVFIYKRFHHAAERMLAEKIARRNRRRSRRPLSGGQSLTTSPPAPPPRPSPPR